MKNEDPKVVKIHDMKIDSDYAQWLNDIERRYRSAQLKAAVRVNAEKLQFNWELGRDLVLRKVEERWGAGVVEQLSLDLQAAFPESNGFSTSNLWRMKQWFSFYSDNAASEKLAQLVREMQISENQNIANIAQPVREFPAILGLVPWGHHIVIIEKCKNIDEALFYITKTIEQGWS